MSTFVLPIVCLSLAASAIADVVIETRSNLRPHIIFDDQPARFGRDLPNDGLLGVVAVAEPRHACGPIKPPPAPPKWMGNLHWIALIERGGGDGGGDCTFERKVERAQAVNFTAVIVYNNMGNQLLPMGGEDSNVIPSVFVGKADGEKISKLYTYKSDRFVVRITDNAPFDINAYLLPFAIVVGICFIIMLGIMIFKCVQDRRRETRHRLPKSSLKKIPTKKFSAGDEEHYETCCICLDDYVIGDKLRVLPCDHAYHVKCIDPWLLKNKRVCPQCRKKVFASGEVPPSDSETDTEDEREPLLARPRIATAAANTFTTAAENPFQRAARRMANRRRSSSLTISTSSSNMSSSPENGTTLPEHIAGNQLTAEIHMEREGTPEQRGGEDNTGAVFDDDDLEAAVNVPLVSVNTAGEVQCVQSGSELV